MLRNSELRELTRQLGKSPRTSLLNDKERRAAESQEIQKSEAKVATKKQK